MATRANSDIEDAVLTLTGSGWLAQTPPDFASTIIGLAQWRRYGAGDTLVRGGDPQADLLGLALGSVAITPTLGPADSPVAHIMTAPTWLGYAPIINRRGRVLWCMARTPVLVAQIRQSALKQLLADHPGHWEYMAMLAFEGLETSLNIATDLMIRNSRRRCAATLLRIAGRRFADGQAPSIAWTNQEELGGIANMARSTLNLILGELESEGLISRGYNQIILHNTAALRAVADG